MSSSNHGEKVWYGKGVRINKIINTIFTYCTNNKSLTYIGDACVYIQRKSNACIDKMLMMVFLVTSPKNILHVHIYAIILYWLTGYADNNIDDYATYQQLYVRIINDWLNQRHTENASAF